ncbi:MAG: 50S ribosome-binding GTPase [Sedimentisphaerales bacterium]|nr:50S ribosome-binding GTPase [Sedimentisphaerales bacterium]
MNVYAAVMTGKGTGAISTIQIFGDSAENVVRKIFKPVGTDTAKFESGKILLGTIYDGEKKIDQVTIGCEQPRTYAVNCHGNPLIVEMIMQLLRRNGAEILTAEQLNIKILTEQKNSNTIAIEAKLVQPKVKTLLGTKIIANQIDAGLSKTAEGWLENIDKIAPEKIAAEANRILQASQTAKPIIYGCEAVLTGPPNSGKSSLLNLMAGRQKSIVTDISGTTRDWVTAECQIDSLALVLTDTAGLDENLPDSPDNIEKAAQKKAFETLEQADLILFVIDNSQNKQPNYKLIQKFDHRKVITILNKSDLPAKFNTGKLPDFLSNAVQISAKTGSGIENLTEKISQTTGAVGFDTQSPVCFTDRQANLLEKLTTAKSTEQLASATTELLNGTLCV